MRAVALALVVTVALPARADVAVARRAAKHQLDGAIFIAIGALNATLSLASFAAVAFGPTPGVALTAAGVALGGGAWAALQSSNEHALMPAMASLSGITGAAGLVLLAVGATLYAAGK